MNQEVLNKLNDFFSNCKTRVYAKNQDLIVAGQDPEGIFLLQEGIVEQYDITPEGSKIAVNIFKPPAFFPMSWAINKAPNSYFFAALTDVQVKQADAAKTVEFLQANPDVMFDLLSRVYKGTDALLRRLFLAASSIASSRLVFELIVEAYRFGTEMEDGNRLISIKQSSLAARSGLARETVSRELHKLATDGLLTTSKQGIVLDIKKLEEKLGFSLHI